MVVLKYVKIGAIYLSPMFKFNPEVTSFVLFFHIIKDSIRL
jgi:hypothetical protein